MSEHAPSHINKRYSAFLFDMDGTIINSIAAAERIWSQWATRHGLDVAAFLPTIHGARGVDTIAKLNLPGVDPHAEALWITEAEIIDVAGIIEISGATTFLKSLPLNKWAIVTSAPRALAVERLRAAGMPLPQVMITGEDVSAGKPHPDCYLLAASKLGVDAADCLVFEDATVGILAGQAAGASVMVVTTTHAHPIDTPHATIASYDTIVASVDGDGLIVLDRRAA